MCRRRRARASTCTTIPRTSTRSSRGSSARRPCSAARCRDLPRPGRRVTLSGSPASSHVMSHTRLAAALALAALLPAASAPAQGHPTVAQFLSPASPLTLASAKKADRIAWMAYERGMRNVYTAAAPGFAPVRLTSWLRDDGIDLTDVDVSDDGSVIVFVRGSAPNRDGWVANPNHDPNGPDRAIWAVRSAGGGAWRVAEGASPELSPDGRSVLYVKDGQIYRARVQRDAVRDSMQTGLKPFIEEW